VVEGQRHRLRPELETVLFRIGQEALTNVAKHAQAHSVNMHLVFNQSCLKLIVKDDGRGFEPEKVLKANHHERSAWGLLGIQERAALVDGVCFIISEPGSGTTIHVTVPLTNKAENHVKN
jgi:signal transduction histidine kinase